MRAQQVHPYALSVFNGRCSGESILSELLGLLSRGATDAAFGVAALVLHATSVLQRRLQLLLTAHPY